MAEVMLEQGITTINVLQLSMPHKWCKLELKKLKLGKGGFLGLGTSENYGGDGTYSHVK